MNCTLRTQVDAFTSWSRGSGISLFLKVLLPRCIFPRCEIPLYILPWCIIPECISLRTPSPLQLCRSATPGNKIFCICDWDCRMSLCFSFAKMRKQVAAHLRCPLCCVGQEICRKLFTWVGCDFLFNPKIWMQALVDIPNPRSGKSHSPGAASVNCTFTRAHFTKELQRKGEMM